MRAEAEDAAVASGHVSLMAFRIYPLHRCALVVAHSAEEGLAYINATLVGDGRPAVRLSECSVRSVQRNVDAPRGFYSALVIKQNEGRHTARTEQGKASKRRKKARQRAARREGIQ